MWWSNLVQLRWFLWAAQTGMAEEAAEDVDTACPASLLALPDLERTAFGALLEQAWTGGLLPGGSDLPCTPIAPHAGWNACWMPWMGVH